MMMSTRTLYRRRRIEKAHSTHVDPNESEISALMLAMGRPHLIDSNDYNR